MAVNKVEINGEVKLDLTQDTVTEDTLLQGATAHDAAGNTIEGKVVTTPVPKTSSLLKGDGKGGVSAATPGKDYLKEAPVTAVNGAIGEVKSTFYVTVTPTGSGYAATADKTAAEVYAAYVAGYAVYAIVNFPGINAPLELPLVAAASVDGTFLLGFGALGSLNPTIRPQYPAITYTGTEWMAWLGTLARSEDIPEIPTAMKNPYALNIKIGNATTVYDGSSGKTVEIPANSYTLPVASATTLGGVKPTTKTSEMSQPVGVDADGALYTEPGDYTLTDTDKSEIAADVIADGIEAQLGDEPLPAPVSASVGQYIRAKTVVNGKITETEAADVSGGGGGETWELIKHITVPDGAAETDALTINTDENGNAFSLKKAKIFGSFPKYAGTSTIPTFSFSMLNGIITGDNSPYCYTSGWVIPVSSAVRRCSIEVDLTKPELQIESVSRNYGTTGIDYFGPQRISAVTSIGGTNMLIYPGCEFWLYGVRA